VEAVGNGSAVTDPSGKQYTWDFENRLTQAVVPGTNGGTSTFRYDSFGRRIQKSSSLGTTNYLYDGPTLIETIDSSAGIISRDAPGFSLDEPLSQLSSGTIVYYEADGSRSITSLSTSSGAVVSTYSYDSFGIPLSTTGALTTAFQYTAREFEEELGIYQYRARYYDPSIGRFLSEDPIAFGGGVNFYSYVLNNPVVLIDPTGLQSQGSYGLRPPNPNINTHVCDGHGGQVPQIANMGPPAQRRCLMDCAVRHEIIHVIESTTAVPTICVGQPAGTVIGSSGLTHNTTEVDASNAEIDCLRKKLDLPCGGGRCRHFILQRILQMQDYRDRRHPYENR
jgi:RHS repeat-associated protein